jgi:hypothetical protein
VARVGEGERGGVGGGGEVFHVGGGESGLFFP